VRQQVKTLGENASQRASQLHELRLQAQSLLARHAADFAGLRQRVAQIVHTVDPNLRCALPAAPELTQPEPLDARFPLPELPSQATLLAADGSQILPDRHAQVSYCLINVGAIQLRLGQTAPPQVILDSRLFDEQQLYTPTGVLTEAQVALLRDLSERGKLAQLARDATPPVITFTDGPMELWGARDAQDSQDYQQNLEKYQVVLEELRTLGATTAGYVDKPAANLVVRLLEVASLEQSQLSQVRQSYPLRGVSDRFLFQRLLAPGERSAVFAIQSRSASNYRDQLSLHFFYLNVGSPGHPWLARVEVPGWVVAEASRLQALHAALVQQCRVLGSRPYPYLLHRAHEAAVVSLEEKEQVTQMIVAELQQRGVEIDRASYKQSANDLAGRTRYER
jgi:hypothetical protein